MQFFVGSSIVLLIGISVVMGQPPGGPMSQGTRQPPTDSNMTKPDIPQGEFDMAEQELNRMKRDGLVPRQFMHVTLAEILEGNITVDMVRFLSPDLLRLLTPDMIETVAFNYDDEMISELCRGLLKRSDPKLLKQYLMHGIDCLSEIGKDPSIEVGEGASHVILENLRGQEPPMEWGAGNWKTAITVPQAVKPSDMKNMNTTVMKDLVKDGSFSQDTFEDNPSNQRAFNDRLKDAYGSPDSWGRTEMEEMGDLVTNLDIDDMKQLSSAAIRDSLSTFKNASFSDPMRKAAFSRRVVEGLGGADSASSWTRNEIEESAQYTLKNPVVMARLGGSKLKSAVSSFKEHVEDKRDALTVARKLKSLSDYADPTALDASALSDLGSTLSGFPPSFTDDLPADAIAGALDELKTGDFPRGQARAMMEKLQNNGQFTPNSMTADDIAMAGNLIAGFDSSVLDSIPAAAMNESLMDLGMMDLSVDQGRAIIKKVKESMGGDFTATDKTFQAKNMGNLFKNVNKKELKEIVDGGHLELDCDAGMALDLDVDRDQAMVVMAKVKTDIGMPTMENTNFTGSCFQVWGKMAAMGMEARDIDGMREDEELPNIMEQMKDHEGEMEEAQTKAMSRKIRSAYLANSTRMEEIDTGIAAQMAPFFKHLNDTELERFNVTLRPTICLGLGKASMARMPTMEIMRLKRHCMMNVLRDDSDTVTDRTNAADRDDNDIRDLGNLMCGLEMSDIDKLTMEAITNNLPTLGKCGFGAEEGKSLLRRAMDMDSQFLNSTENLGAAGMLLEHLSDSERDTIPADKLAEAFLDMADTFDEADEMRRKRDESFSAEYNSTQRAADKEQRALLFRAGLQALQDSGISSRRRRSTRARRATSSLTCADVQSMSGSVTSLDASDITDMDTTEFTDCLETFGSVSDWDDDQLTALGTAAKAALGGVDTWTAEEIRQAGSIVGSLTSSEIESLALESTDVMSSIGMHAIYEASQRLSGYSRWLSLTQSDSVTNVDSDELTGLGHFACGITTNDIADIAPATYYEAASSIGSLTSCEVAQLSAYAVLAKDDAAFGSDVTAWDSATITAVGSAIGGLTSSEIASLSEDQIAALTPSVIAQIPPSTFAGLSAEQLGYLTTSQATAVTAEQQMALSSEQLDVLYAAGAYELTSDSAASALMPFSLLVLPLTYFAIRL